MGPKISNLPNLFRAPPRGPTRGKQPRASKKTAGIIDWSKNLRFVAAVIVFIAGSFLSPLLGLFFGLVVFSGACVDVADYLKKNSEMSSPNEFRFRILRFLDAFRTLVLFSSFRKRFEPTEAYQLPPGRAVSILGGGWSFPEGKFNPDKPFLRLSWVPPNRLSFWVAVSAGTVCGCYAWLLTSALIDLSTEMLQQELSFAPYVWGGFTALGGFLLSAGIAESLRWSRQQLDLSATEKEPTTGYIAASLNREVLSYVFNPDSEDISAPQGGDSPKSVLTDGMKQVLKIAGLGVLVAAVLGIGFWVAALGLFPSNITDGPPVLTQPLVGIVAVAGVALGAAWPLSHLIKKMMCDLENRRKQQQHYWEDIFLSILKPNDPIPVWASTHKIDTCEDTDLTVHTFVLNYDIISYRQMAGQIASTADKVSGVVVEGAEAKGRAMTMSPSGVCQYLLVYTTSSNELGKSIQKPHLRHWENLEESTTSDMASPEGMFALRLAFADALNRASIPDMLITSARQHHVADFMNPEVVWEINCEYRGTPMTAYQLQQKTEVLREALRCEWLKVGKSDIVGEVQFWLSSRNLRDVELKDEQGSTQSFYAVPGGTETKNASPTRQHLIEAEWGHLLSRVVKGLPEKLEIEQQCWNHQTRNEMIAEVVVNTVIRDDDMDAKLAEILNAKLLYSQVDVDKRATKIVWGLNVNPSCYLSPLQDERFKAAAAAAAVTREWRPSSSSKSCVVAIEDVKFHSLGDEKELIEVVCIKGRSDPLENYEESFITQSIDNLNVEWLRVGQSFSEGAPDASKFSVVFSSVLEPSTLTFPGTRLYEWVYGLERTWGYAQQNPKMYRMIMTHYDSLVPDHTLKRTRWLIPTGTGFPKMAELTTKTDEALAETVMIPGRLKDDLKGIYLISGEHIPVDNEMWLDPSDAEQVAKWNWEKMMLLCKIKSYDNKVPELMETKIIGKTHRHLVRLPVGMGSDEMTKEGEKIKSTGNYSYLEMRPEAGNKVIATTAFEDPLTSNVNLRQLSSVPSDWYLIPLGVGISPQKEVPEGSSEFDLCWNLKAAPHMLVAGSTGSGKTSAMRVIAAEAVARNFDLRIIDIVKQCADFSGIYEYDQFCSRVAVNLDDASDLISDTYETVTKRAKKNSQLSVMNWYERSVTEKPQPIMLIIDECFSMLQKSPGGNAAKEENNKKDEMTVLISKIAREARSAGIHLLLAAQRPDAKVLEGELKSNLGARLLLGNANHTARDMVLPDAALAPKLDQSNTSKGRGLFYQEGLETCLIQTFWAGESQEVTENLRLMLSKAWKVDIKLNSTR